MLVRTQRMLHAEISCPVQRRAENRAVSPSLILHSFYFTGISVLMWGYIFGVLSVRVPFSAIILQLGKSQQALQTKPSR